MENGKRRHGCLAAWLVLMIVANSASALMYLLRGDAIRQSFPSAPGWLFPLLIVCLLFNIVCAIALFQWKKWAFWGFCGSVCVTFVVNISIGIGIGLALNGVIGAVLLFGVLQIGKENKGWSQLD